MVNNTSRNRKLLAGTVGVTLSLALAISAGAVPMPGDDGPVRAASVTQIEEVATVPARQPGDITAEVAPAPAPAPAAVAASAAAAPAVTAAPTTVPKPRVTAPPTTKAPVAKAAPVTGAPVVAPVAAVPVAPVKVARLTPTDAQVLPLIAELKRQIGGLAMFATITPLQIADAGNQICTAFDNGQSFAQVKSTGLTMIPPTIVVKPATIDWAVRQGVALYCPGHTSKLV